MYQISGGLTLTRHEARNYVQKEVKIPGKYTRIGEEAFSRQPRIHQVHFPSSLERIDAHAFCMCSSLKEIKLPCVKILGEGVFQQCSSLHAAYLPVHPDTISPSLFREDRNLQKVLFPKGNRLQHIGEHAFEGCQSLEQIRIPSGVRTIGASSFSKCKALKTVRFPEQLISIDTRAFYFCGMNHLELPDTLEYLGDSAFFKCNWLTTVRLPASVRYIGKWVFHGCNRLQVLEIRHDPEFIGEWIINRAARIRCYRGSAVDRYCQSSGFTVEYID